MPATIWSPPDARAVATAQAVAHALGLTGEAGKRLICAGLVGERFDLDDRGRSVAGERDALGALMTRRLLDPEDSTLPPAIVVKASNAAKDPDDEDRWMGWHTDMPDGVAEVATNRWWPIAAPETVEGHLLVVTVATVVVRVRVVVGHARRYGRIALETAPISADPRAAVYQHARIKTRPGSLIERVNL